jgi:hypothetical protein
MKLHLVYDFGGKETSEDFTISNPAWQAMKSLAAQAAKLTNTTEAEAVKVCTEFYGELTTLAQKNARQAFEFLRGKPDDQTDERKAYSRLFASFVLASPRLSDQAKFLQQAQEYGEAKDGRMADAMKLAASGEGEKARKEALKLAVGVLRVFSATVADPTAPADEPIIPGGEDRIRATIKDYEAALETPRGPMKNVADALILRVAVYALQQVLAGKIKIPQATPMRDRSAEKAGDVRELTADEIAEEYGELLSE